MFSHSPFFFGLLRKYEAYFAYVFSNLHIERDASVGIGQLIKVPLQNGSKNKTLVRADADPNINKDTSLTLPRMSYRYTNIRYDSTRKLPSTVQVAAMQPNNASKMQTQFVPMPFDIDFELYIMVNQQEDGTRIIEQIYPQFTPDFTATLKLIPDMAETVDIPITYKSTTIEDIFSGDLLQNRILTYTLQFTMRAYFYGPVVDKPIIEFAIENFKFDANGANIGSITVQPGQLANGSPTTNAAATIAANQIFANTSYGYIVTANGQMKLAGN